MGVATSTTTEQADLASSACATPWSPTRPRVRTGELGSQGNNLASDASCALTAGGDLPGVNPLLGPLAANGGPTQTHALLAGSPAIDAGTAVGAPATDRRGVARPVGAGIDIGAFEGSIGGAGPTISIGDASVVEGNAGTVNATFTVSLSAASASTVTVNFATADVSASAGSDYSGASGIVTFAAGQTSQPVVVAVVGDTAAEAKESFVVNLSGASGATILDAQGVGTISNDDAALPRRRYPWPRSRR